MDFRLTAAVLLWVTLLSLALYSACQRKASSNERWWVLFGAFSLVLAIALPVWRWRSLVYNGEINVDESQILAQALRYKLDPIPWRSVDGGSGGPLYTWAVFWAPLVGLKFTYLAARITGLACYFLMCLALGLTASRLVGRRLALLLTMPVVTLSLTAFNFDYVFFSSEQLPMALMAWACYLLTLQAPTPRAAPAYLLGFLTGALPFCKIQAAPAGVILWLIGAGSLWVFRKSAVNLRNVIIAQVLGGLSVAVLILTPVILQGAWGEFVTLYIKGGLGYQSSANTENVNPMSHLWMLVNAVPEFKAYYIALLVLVSSGVLVGVAMALGKRKDHKPWIALLAAVLFTITIAFSIARSGYAFAHYTLLLLVPLTVLAGVFGLFVNSDVLEKPAFPNVALMSAALLSVFFQGRQVWQDYQKQPALLGNWGNGIHPIGELIQKLTKPGDTILVWGYAPKFHVFSGVPPSYRVITTLPLLVDPDTSQESPAVTRYLADLAKYPPALIIDAPDEFWFPDPKVPKGSAARHFLHPSTSSLVSKNYELMGQIDYPEGPPGMPKKLPIFIYRKKT